MSNKGWYTTIQYQIKAAIEEFGDDAYRRFNSTNELPWLYNSELLNNLETVTLKPLSELFAHDVEVYGDDAHKIWKFRLISQNDYCDFGTNEFVIDAIKRHEVYVVVRKESAELPFDLEHAKSGSAIERLNGEDWHDCEFVSHHKNEIIVLQFGYEISILHDYNWMNFLRMKYPKKVNNADT